MSKRPPSRLKGPDVLNPPNSDGGPIRRLRTDIPGLDSVLGGGLPEYSFNLIAGGPGTGKTTMAQQIAYANATAERPALYFTVLGEPTLKMLRYQQQFRFFDIAKVGTAVQYINLSVETLEGDLAAVLARIVSEVERLKPGIVIVDSFRTLSQAEARSETKNPMSVEHFVQRLALDLTSWEVTSFLIGEYHEIERRHPVFTVADGIFWLSQVVDRNSVVRKLHVLKARGVESMPGLHTFRITSGGLEVFPRIPEQQASRETPRSRRQKTGVPGLDKLMGGGVPAGDAVMIIGPAGSGKTTFATQFASQGLREGERVVIAVFEEYPEEYVRRAQARDRDIGRMIEAGKLKVIYLRPLDLSVDETLAAILEAVEEIGATRVVIDSLSGFEVALAPTFRDEFQESLYRLVGALTATGVTVLMTTETTGGYANVQLTTAHISFITDDIVVQQFAEIDGALEKVLVVLKMRGSQHSTEFHRYAIDANGATIKEPLGDFRGIGTGHPKRKPGKGAR